MTSSFHSFLHNTSIAMLVIAPVLIALPPRKLDLYTFFLGGGFVASANHLIKERTGAGILYQFPGTRLPPMAEEYRERMKDRTRLLEEPQSSRVPPVKHREAQGLEKVAKDIWMGGEKEGWKEKRLREEQEKIEQGEGYGSMIMDQIWEVWNQGEKTAEEVKAKDEKVVEERRREKARVVQRVEREHRRDLEFPVIGKDDKW